MAQIHPAGVRDPAVHDGLVEALVRLGQVNVLAHQSDLDLGQRAAHGLDHPFPAGHLRGARPDVEQFGDLLVHALLEKSDRHFIDAGHILGGKHCIGRHVGKQRDLLLQVRADGLGRPAQQDVGLDADLTQLHHRVLRRLGLQLARGGDIGHQGHVHRDGVLMAQLEAQLAHGFKEGQRLDVAHGSTNLDDEHVHALGTFQHARLDGIGHMRDHLDRAAQVLPAPFLLDDR